MKAEKVPESERFPTSAIQAIETAAVDQQIATAKQYPRDVGSFLARAESMISEDRERAAEMGYSLTRSGKAIVGPSVRLAEVAVNAWGNLRVMIVEEELRPTDSRVTVYGMAHDLESNVAVRIPKVRRITNRQGVRFGEDMIATTINAAVSLAYRDAAFRVIPRTFIDQLYDHAMRVAGGDEEALPETRARLVEAFEAVGVKTERLLQALDVQGVSSITLQHIGPLRSIYDRIRREELTPEQAFPERKQGEEAKAAEADIAKGKAKAKKKAGRKKAAPTAPKSVREVLSEVDEEAEAQPDDGDADEIGEI